jgi:YD repeat-containing protein
MALVKRLLGIILFTFFSSSYALAIVDMRNANYSDTWIDMQVKGSAYDLRIQRTYNSRTLYSGMFGFGWCAEFETTLKTTATNTLRVTECGAGVEMEFFPSSYSNAEKEKLIKSIIKEVRTRNKGRDAKFFAKLESDLNIDGTLRDEFARQLNISSAVKSGQKYTANGRATDFITFNGSEYVRQLPNSTIQKFNKDGQLIQMSDKNANFIKVAYKNAKVVSITDALGATIQFKYPTSSQFVSEAVGPSGLKATYDYKGENLMVVNNAWKNKFTYAYDNLNNMTLVTYPDKSTIKISYNQDKDWVTSFKDRNECVETYTYAANEKTPLDNYTSGVEKKCKGQVTNKSSYEFWHETRADGTRYLSRARSDNNGSITDTIYDPRNGRPLEISQDSIVTRYEYNKQGLLSKKLDPFKVQNFSYNEKCGKVSFVESSYTLNAPRETAKAKKAKSITKKVSTSFTYDPARCNLVSAKNTDGQNVSLTYDNRGRITKIADQSKKEINITYEERFGKPYTVSRPGLGSIKFKYKNDGSMEKFDSDEDPTIAIQVASIFSNLLEVIAPATTDINNI